MHTISQRRKLHIAPRADPPVIRRTWELHVWSIAHPRYYCFYMERKKPENAGTAEGRESSVFQAEDAKANNTQHTLRGKCGNTGWEVRQWKLHYGEQRDLGERRRGRGMATQAAGADFLHDTKGDCFDGGGLQSVKETKWQHRCTRSHEHSLDVQLQKCGNLLLSS